MGRANLLMHTKYTRWWHNAFILYMPPHMSWTKQFQRRDTYSHWTHLIDFPFFKSAALSTNLQTWPPKSSRLPTVFGCFLGGSGPQWPKKTSTSTWLHWSPLCWGGCLCADCAVCFLSRRVTLLFPSFHLGRCDFPLVQIYTWGIPHPWSTGGREPYGNPKKHISEIDVRFHLMPCQCQWHDFDDISRPMLIN